MKVLPDIHIPPLVLLDVHLEVHLEDFLEDFFEVHLEVLIFSDQT